MGQLFQERLTALQDAIVNNNTVLEASNLVKFACNSDVGRWRAAGATLSKQQLNQLA